MYFILRGGTVQGDEGGGLACPAFAGGGYLLVGALSGGVDCATKDVPDIYKSFLHVSRDWIRDTIVSLFPLVPPPGNSSQSLASHPGNSTQSPTPLPGNPTQSHAPRPGNPRQSPPTPQTSNPTQSPEPRPGNPTQSPDQVEVNKVDIEIKHTEEMSFSTEIGDNFSTEGPTTIVGNETLYGSFLHGSCSLYKHPGKFLVNIKTVDN